MRCLLFSKFTVPWQEALEVCTDCQCFLEHRRNKLEVFAGRGRTAALAVTAVDVSPRRMEETVLLDEVGIAVVHVLGQSSGIEGRRLLSLIGTTET
jgi:hypothetical protein